MSHHYQLSEHHCENRLSLFGRCVKLDDGFSQTMGKGVNCRFEDSSYRQSVI